MREPGRGRSFRDVFPRRGPVRRTLLILAALLGSIVRSASAQVCLGTPPFDRGPVGLRGAASVGNDQTHISAGLQAGGSSIFGGASFDRISYRNVDRPGFGGSINLGWQLRANRWLRACPVVEAGLTWGPDFDLGDQRWEVDTRIALAGIAVGTTLEGGGNLEIAPSFMIGYAYGGTKVIVDGEEVLSGAKGYGVFRVSVGLLFWGVGLTPFVNVPIGLEDYDPSVGVSLRILMRPY